MTFTRILCAFGATVLLAACGTDGRGVGFSKFQIDSHFEAQSPECQANYAAALGQPAAFMSAAWVSTCVVGETVDDAELHRIVFERCEHFTGGNCKLVRSRGVDVDGAYQAQTIQYPTTFDAAVVPFIRDAGRVQLSTTYAEETQPKALAITGGGAWSWAVGPDEEAAKRNATAQCKEFAGAGGCILYAVGDRVLFIRETELPQ